MLFVVCCHVEMQDGHEDWSEVVPSKEAALALINKHANHCGANAYFRLFLLGKEIALERADVTEDPPPPKVVRGYKVKGTKKQ